MARDNQIVADGRERVWNSPDCVRKREEIERAIEERYRPEIERAGLLRKLVLYARKRRELERELEKLAPLAGNYLRNGLRA